MASRVSFVKHQFQALISHFLYASKLTKNSLSHIQPSLTTQSSSTNFLSPPINTVHQLPLIPISCKRCCVDSSFLPILKIQPISTLIGKESSFLSPKDHREIIFRRFLPQSSQQLYICWKFIGSWYLDTLSSFFSTISRRIIDFLFVVIHSTKPSKISISIPKCTILKKVVHE